MTQTTLREYLRTTEDAISSGRIDEAMANCQNILTYFPEALEAQRLLGEVYLAQGHLEEAQQTFEWVLTNDPENVIVYCDRALISERTSDIDTALDCYQQAYELSRGNANIRQEFNQLSARAGQPEFMFSRAGLARLYMRGDLLTQAIQEWDAVLAVSPERLDARLGLMETYWREGLYDKAETIAKQLLEEIPTCLKALLFLAHITSISNLPRARELLQRAEALDPDLTMAQEIFADLTARQPNDPFLELLKKEPILLENGIPINFQPSTPSAPVPTPAPGAPTALSPTNLNMLNSQNGQASGDALTHQSLPDSPSPTAWNPNVGSSSKPDLPSWQEMLESPSTAKAEQPWYQNEQFTAANGASPQNWNSPRNSGPLAANWSSEIQDEEVPAHPAWLDTLTRSEQQPTAEMPFQAPAPSPSTSQAETVASSSQVSPLPESKPTMPAEEAMPFFFPPADESESDMGWPEWLKSLGAEALEPEPTTPSEPLPEIDATPVRPLAENPAWETTPRVEPEQQAPEADPWAALPSMSASNEAWSSSENQPDWMQQLAPAEHTPTQNATPDWMQQFAARENTSSQSTTPDWMKQFSPAQHTPEQSATPDWMKQFSPAQHTPEQSATPDWMRQLGSEQPATQRSTPAAEQEQRYVASLADLEKDLQSQGFVPLAPGSLASIAQAQQNAPAPSVPSLDPAASSALAQLGNFSQPSAAPTSDEPWWNRMATPQASQQPAATYPASEQSNPFAALGARMPETTAQPLSPLPATPTPMPPAQSYTPGTQEMSPALTPAYRSDALLDSDLETTMKRPAITLQPMHAGESQGDRAYQGRSERRTIEHADESSLSNHDRLVRGYQYQLSGSYEEAMQDYRLIIRNAPELLEDVISNLRALLKINPRFSLGYRVLGDAYMRKGEYLQAMESYNKALTMAKKARN
jgi:tetratricopeptide (TPR) repeat protein